MDVSAEAPPKTAHAAAATDPLVEAADRLTDRGQMDPSKARIAAYLTPLHRE
jgi:hypothetical protein